MYMTKVLKEENFMGNLKIHPSEDARVESIECSST